MIELREAVAVEDGYTDLEEDDLPDPSVIVECCCSLVTYEHTTGIVRFTHYTVAGFLESKDYILTTVDLARTCLTYLLFDVFEDGPCCNEEEFKLRMRRYRFAEYIAQYWETYVRGSR